MFGLGPSAVGVGREDNYINLLDLQRQVLCYCVRAGITPAVLAGIIPTVRNSLAEKKGSRRLGVVWTCLPSSSSFLPSHPSTVDF